MVIARKDRDPWLAAFHGFFFWGCRGSLSRMETTVAQLIVQMVSPAVMISGCGLMLLTLGNKYARVVDRIRAFAAEARALHEHGDRLAAADAARMRTLDLQIPDLFRRGRLLRNAVLHFYTAVALFVVCSFTIPLTRFGAPSWVPLVMFCAGMACVLVATSNAWRETLLSFRLLNLEVSPRQP
jgi:hypothetical protein